MSTTRRLPFDLLTGLGIGALGGLVAVLARAGWEGGVVQSLASRKDALEAIQSIVTTLGIVAAAIWFVRRRENFPKADISQTIVHREIAPGQIWMRVSAILTNKGSLRIDIKNTLIIIEQVDPAGDEVQEILAKPGNERPRALVRWPYLYKREEEAGERPLNEIEPGETDSVNWDFSIPTGTKLVSVYTYLQNETKRGKDFGWTARSIYDLAKAVPGSTETVVPPPPQPADATANAHDAAAVGRGVRGTRSGAAEPAPVPGVAPARPAARTPGQPAVEDPGDPTDDVESEA